MGIRVAQRILKLRVDEANKVFSASGGLGEEQMGQFRRILTVFVSLACSAAAGAQVSVVGPLTHEFTVQLGASYDGTIDLSNVGDKPAEVKLYQTDYFFYADGTVQYGTPGELPRSNAKWITLSPKLVVVPPKETVQAHFSVQTPDDATLTGTYWSLVMVEPVPEGSPESGIVPADRPTLGVREVFRYSVQIVTHVGDTGTRSLKFVAMKLLAENGKRVLVVDAENTGERWLRGTLAVDLYDAKGAFVGKFTGNKKRLFPLTSVQFAADLPGVANGTYKALIVVDCGGDDVFGVNVNLVLKD